MKSIDKLLSIWKNDPAIRENIVVWNQTQPYQGDYFDFPNDLHPTLRQALIKQGITSLYTHQMRSWLEITAGNNVVITTGTSSGKTLCYNLPVLDSLIRTQSSRALYLFPTKALTQDQCHHLQNLIENINQCPEPGLPHTKLSSNSVLIYDGDTPSSQRAAVRNQARIILTNPDMLHVAVLPHHTLWADFFRNLKYIVIDESHVYRGVFGSHVANVIRRLRRIASFYGGFPQFILTSATISNPIELAEKMVEAQVTLIDEDSSPHGERNFLIYNPPLAQPELGIRKGAGIEGVRLTGDLLTYQIQTLIFTRARRSVELLLRNLREQNPEENQKIHGYRSGYLAEERREIEKGLRQGEARVVVATNALELGIDVGSMDAVVMIGYPGTVAATRQQAGRAGRRQSAALAVLVASANPLDQFLVKHPEFIFDRSPEMALIDPDNILILLQHVRCAAFELPFRKGEKFGLCSPDLLQEIIDLMAQEGTLHPSGDRYYWVADQYPASTIPLRSVDGQPVLLQATQDGKTITIGEVDQASSRWMAHPDAIYLHQGSSYRVEDLDLENNVAHLTSCDVDYYTEAKKKVEVEPLSRYKQELIPGGSKNYGEIMVTMTITGYRKIRWFSLENLGEFPLEIPPTQLRTMAYWITLNQETIDSLREVGLWRNDPNDYGPGWNRIKDTVRQRDHYTCQVCGAVEKGPAFHVHHKIPFRTFTSFVEANRPDNLVTLCPNCHQKAEVNVKIRSGLSGLSYVIHQLSPLSLMCDISDLGLYFEPQSVLGEGLPSIAIYDQIPAGLGLSERLYQEHANLVARAEELIQSCECRDGCPACVGPAGENGLGAKEETLALLAKMQ